MLNPWDSARPGILLGLLVFWLASVTGAYFKGSEAAQEAARAQYATQLEATIAEHNADSLIDMESALAWGEANAKAKTRFSEVKNVALEAISAAPLAANCSWDKPSFDALLAAIKESNSDTIKNAVSTSNNK